MHIAKIEWLRLGDGNNAYFNALVERENKQTSIQVLHKDDGIVLTTQA